MTNELKCPVCGEGMKPDPWNADMYMHIKSEQGKICVFTYDSKKRIEEIGALIQSRLDKAVIAERERIMAELDKEKPLTVLMPAMYQKIIKIINVS